MYLGHYSDDFLREITLDYLFYYYDKNNFELQKTIQTLSKSQYFNTTINDTIEPRGSCMKCCCCALYFCCFGWVIGCMSGKGCSHMCCCF